MNKQFIPERLKEARLEAGLNMTELASKADLSKASISQYEKGITNPKFQTVLQLGLILGKNESYFYTPLNRSMIEESSVFFRSFTTKSVKSQGIALIKKNQIIDIVQYIFSILKERPVEVPEDFFIQDSLAPEVDDFEIDALALRIREFWGLGEGPVVNLAYLLENKGFICCPIELPEKIDAFSVNIRKPDSNILHPIIIYEKDSSYFRQRFDLAHELGHFILHSMLEFQDLQSNLKHIENQANRFASAFLLPAPRFHQTIFSTSLDALISLKRHWEVSIAAIMRRMLDLNMIDDRSYTNFNIELSRKKWRIIEPLDKEYAKEKTYFLSKAFDYIVSNKLADLNGIISQLGYDIKTMADLTNNHELFKNKVQSKRIEFVFST